MNSLWPCASLGCKKVIKKVIAHRTKKHIQEKGRESWKHSSSFDIPASFTYLGPLCPLKLQWLLLNCFLSGGYRLCSAKSKDCSIFLQEHNDYLCSKRQGQFSLPELKSPQIRMVQVLGSRPPASWGNLWAKRCTLHAHQQQKSLYIFMHLPRWQFMHCLDHTRSYSGNSHL